MMNEFEKRTKATKDNKNHLIKCITFGAPYFGDLELKDYCDKRGFSKNIYHCVNYEDPVPRILSYSLCLQVLIGCIC